MTYSDCIGIGSIMHGLIYKRPDMSRIVQDFGKYVYCSQIRRLPQLIVFALNKQSSVRMLLDEV